MSNPLAPLFTSRFAIYRLTSTVDSSNGPVRTYSLFQSNIPCSWQPQNDHVWDPLGSTNREVYKSSGPCLFDPAVATVLSTDRIKINGKLYDQTGSPSDQGNMGYAVALDLQEVVGP
jgi:hypothetical protein